MQELAGGGVTSAQGFVAAAAAGGIKPGSSRDDVAVVHSQQAASAAAVFTTNRVQAAPIAIDRQHLADGRARAVVLNSGNANACTGARGEEDARRMCALTALGLGLDAAEVLVCSTGVIGVPLPMAAVEAAIPRATAALSAAGGAAAARAIMTTDTVPKECAVALETGGLTLRVGGMAKGSGMIAPNMATMLAVVTTDAPVPTDRLGPMLTRVADRTFNCVTVDGDMSTNDTLILLANGAAGARELDDGSYRALEEGLEHVCGQLSRMIARDGEGASKLVVIRVTDARDEAAARRVGLSVANSALVKTAIFGNDPNWGRILCAMGYAGVEFDPGAARVVLCGVPIYASGAGLAFDAHDLSTSMQRPEVTIDISLGNGTAAAQVLTCDLSYEYVRINAEYTT